MKVCPTFIYFIFKLVNMPIFKYVGFLGFIAKIYDAIEMYIEFNRYLYSRHDEVCRPPSENIRYDDGGYGVRNARLRNKIYKGAKFRKVQITCRENEDTTNKKKYIYILKVNL